LIAYIFDLNAATRIFFFVFNASINMFSSVHQYSATTSSSSSSSDREQEDVENEGLGESYIWQLVFKEFEITFCPDSGREGDEEDGSNDVNSESPSEHVFESSAASSSPGGNCIPHTQQRLHLNTLHVFFQLILLPFLQLKMCWIRTLKQLCWC